MTIKARLSGDDFDLQTLARALGSDTEPTVAQDEVGFYLTSPALDSLFADGGKMYEIASRLLTRANGIGRLSDSSFRPAQLSGDFNDGSRSHRVVQAGVAEARFHLTATATVVSSSGSTQAPPAKPKGQKVAESAAANKDVDEALSWLAKAQGESVWFHLNKSYEVIREGVGGVPPAVATQKLVATGWTTQAEIDAFANSANTQSVSGELARHARGRPKNSNTMTSTEGIELIGRLLAAWAATLAP
ncbi:hypothetical protein [Amycolatopsis sp. NPDC051061]|uniref:hypothetical protein n=1 Tax=Amycolatopsis sp. NPDC051061 TaxID=3155042 RepID=UPI0034188AD2